MKRHLLFICAAAFAGMFFIAPSVQAQNINIIEPTPEVGIPGLEFSNPDKLKDQITINEGEQTTITLQIPYIGEYLAALYRYAVAIATIVAIVMIIVAGFQWAFSGGSQDAIGSAKKRIVGAVTGLILVAGSYTILYTINPDLVRFRSLSLQYIEGVEANLDDVLLDTPGDNTDDIKTFAGTPAGMTRLTQDGYPNIIMKEGSTHFLRPAVATALKTASDRYRQISSGGRGRIVLNSSLRTPDEQYALMVKHCKCDPVDDLPLNVNPEDWRGKNICRSTASACGVASYSIIKRVNGEMQTKALSHLGGFAVDINAFPSKSTVKCDSLKGDPDEAALLASAGVANVPGRTPPIGPDDCIPKSQQLLIKVMLDNGFCVGLKGNGLREAWHFEHISTANSVGKTSTFCTSDKSDPNLQKLQFVN